MGLSLEHEGEQPPKGGEEAKATFAKTDPQHLEVGLLLLLAFTLFFEDLFIFQLFKKNFKSVNIQCISSFGGRIQ